HSCSILPLSESAVGNCVASTTWANWNATARQKPHETAAMSHPAKAGSHPTVRTGISKYIVTYESLVPQNITCSRRGMVFLSAFTPILPVKYFSKSWNNTQAIYEMPYRTNQ